VQVGGFDKIFDGNHVRPHRPSRCAQRLVCGSGYVSVCVFVSGVCVCMAPCWWGVVCLVCGYCTPHQHTHTHTHVSPHARAHTHAHDTPLWRQQHAELPGGEKRPRTGAGACPAGAPQASRSAAKVMTSWDDDDEGKAEEEETPYFLADWLPFL